MKINPFGKLKLNPSIFRAYDIRGVYPTEINEEVVYHIGQALVKFLKAKNIVVGRDARLCSPALKHALVKGLTEAGSDVIDIGLSTSPMLYFGVNFWQGDGGVMISASHNPPKYNGLKLVREKAIPISGQTGIEQIKNLVQDARCKIQDIGEKGKVFQKDIKKDYINFLTEEVKVNLPGKVVLDAGNGMAGLVLPEVLKKLKVDYEPLYFEPDGTFPHHEANPLKQETLKDLKAKMKETKALLGVAFDGDSDRVAFLDEKRRLIRGDFITAFLSQRILREKREGTVLYDLRSSKIVPETISQAGGRPIKTRVGHSFIKALMREEKAVFAGELSCHFYFPFEFPQGLAYFESDILAMIKIFEGLSETQKPLSALIRPFQKYFHSGEINFEVEDKKKAILKKLAQIYSDGQISWLDGLTVEYPEWWFNVRLSNTEDLVRLNLEAKTKKLMAEKIEAIRKILS